MVKRWEYMTVWLRIGAQKGKWTKDEEFNRLGAEGWELVGIFVERAIFKRPLPASE
jgi:hypothetical protein